MSIAHYEQQYQQTLADLAEIQQEDAYLSAMRINSDARTRNAHYLQYWLSIYMRYLRLSRRLAELHDTELHPQKLNDTRTLLNSCLGRMLETKALLVKNCGDFLPLDDQLLDIKVNPEGADVPIPTYILEDRADELKQRRSYVVSLQGHYAEVEPDAPVTAALRDPRAQTDPSKAVAPLATKKGPPKVAIPLPEEEEKTEMSLDEAVRVLQACERGRQARQRAAFQLVIHRQQRYVTQHSNEFNTVTGKDRAATVVQKVVQGYLERKRARQRYEAERRFLGLAPTEEILRDDERVAAALRAQDRKSRQKMNTAELRQNTIEMQEKLKTTEGPKTMEAMLDEVLMHMAYARMESKDGTIVELPPAAEGGSLKMLGRLSTSTSKKDGGNRRRSRARSSVAISEAGEAATAAAPGGSRASSAAASTRGGKKGGKKEDEDLTEPLPPSVFWATMAEGSERYATRWRPYYEETRVKNGDLDQRADDQALREELLQGPRGIMSELRQCVDQLVMMEVTNLKARLEFEKNAKKKKKKKGKKAGKVRKPKLKDPTKGITLDTALNTMIFENKLQVPPESTQLSSFVGCDNTMSTPLDQLLRGQKPDDEIKKKWQRIIRNWNEDVEKALRMKKEAFEKLFDAYLHQSTWLSDPTIVQLRRAVTEYAVLPLGSQVINDLSPQDRSLLFYGFPGTGKTMMAYALCNESGANFFNLSPSNFSSMKGIVKMIQLVFYVARMKGPSVIYIDGIEKIFPGKKKGAAKQRKKDPLFQRGKKMKKELIKSLNTIQATDRVKLVAVSSEPWLADPVAIATHFQHTLHFPTPDYANRMVLLKHFLRERIASCVDAPAMDSRWEMDTADYEQIALLTDGWTPGQLRSLVDRTLHPRRVQQILQRPLKSSDFVNVLSTIKPPTAEERQLMLSFTAQLPYAVRRANPPEDFKESEEEAKKRKMNTKKKPKAA